MKKRYSLISLLLLITFSPFCQQLEIKKTTPGCVNENTLYVASHPYADYFEWRLYPQYLPGYNPLGGVDTLGQHKDTLSVL